MQYNIHLPSPPSDLAGLESAVREVDPSAVLDLDPNAPVLRVSSVLGDADLAAVISDAGTVVGLDRIERLPSNCCGGCGG